MNAKSQLAPKGTPTVPHAAAPETASAQPPRLQSPPQPLPWFPLDGAELLAKPYMVASDDKGTNAIAAVRKATRHLENWQWKTGFKWMALLGGAPLTFMPTHYQDLPDGWMMKE